MCRGVKFKMLNAMLKLSTLLRDRGELPPAHVLQPYVDSIRANYRRQYEIVAHGDVVAPGLRADAIYSQRFNFAGWGNAVAQAPRRRGQSPAIA